jgi:acetyl-CoA carboxylase biotin carboxyl carrier protein
MAEGDEREPLLTDDIRELLRLVNQGDISEVLIRRGDAKVHIKRGVAHQSIVTMAPAVASQGVPVGTYMTQFPPAESLAQATNPPLFETGVIITAPMVGTYYGSPSPKDAPYIQVGDEVRPGDVLGIIEAMKIMNEIECEIHGRVMTVLVANGQPVEYGQPLMIIEPL